MQPPRASLVSELGTSQALAHLLGAALSYETIIEPEAFEAFAHALRAHLDFLNVGITIADGPDFYRVLAVSRGAGEEVSPFRTRLTGSRPVYRVLYEERRPYFARDLGEGTETERASTQYGMGSYVALPIPHNDAIVASLFVSYREADGAQNAPLPFLQSLCAAIGPSVERGLRVGRDQRAARILEATGDALLAWDAEGRLIDVNRAAERLVGATRAELLGSQVQGLLGAIPMGLSSPQRLTLIARDGRRVTVAATVSPVHGDPLVFAHALLRDLSDVVAAERDASEHLAQLRELTEQHMVLLDNAPLVIFRLDPETHEVLYLNRHAERLFGVSAEEVLTKEGFLRSVHVDPEGELAFEEAVVVAKLGQVMPAYEARLHRRGDEPITARGTIYPILAENGRVIGVEGILLDVTSERAARSRLVQADRLATVGMLAAGVAHEINNPAAFMLLGLDVLSRNLSSGEVTMTPQEDKVIKQLVTDLKETGRRIVAIARDLRTFASPPPARPGRRMLVDIDRTIESALTITRAQIVEKADLEVELAPDLPLVSMDDGRLGQVIVNLLVNAAQAISEARAQRGPLPGGDRVRIVTRMAPNAVQIEVEDSGAGIKPELLERVFTPFFTTKQPEVGTGLGLAISKTIIESAGGTIRAESPIHPGPVPSGSRFVISLPVELQSTAGTSSAEVRGSSVRARVLVVEDEVLLGRALAAQLATVHDVAVAAGGEEAFHLLSKPFDVVLCDVKMPAMGGEALFRKVAERDPSQAQRFVFMTGVGFGPELDRFLAEVGLPMIEKPFPVDRALGAIETVMQKFGAR